MAKIFKIIIFSFFLIFKINSNGLINSNVDNFLLAGMSYCLDKINLPKPYSIVRAYFTSGIKLCLCLQLCRLYILTSEEKKEKKIKESIAGIVGVSIGSILFYNHYKSK